MAKVAKKTWPWPGLPGFTRPHFPGKLGKKPGKPGLARLCQAGRVFDRAPDAREAIPPYIRKTKKSFKLKQDTNVNW